MPMSSRYPRDELWSLKVEKERVGLQDWTTSDRGDLLSGTPSGRADCEESPKKEAVGAAICGGWSNPADQGLIWRQLHWGQHPCAHCVECVRKVKFHEHMSGGHLVQVAPGCMGESFCPPPSPPPPADVEQRRWRTRVLPCCDRPPWQQVSWEWPLPLSASPPPSFLLVSKEAGPKERRAYPEWQLFPSRTKVTKAVSEELSVPPPHLPVPSCPSSVGAAVHLALLRIPEELFGLQPTHPIRWLRQVALASTRGGLTAVYRCRGMLGEQRL